jgi:NADH-quinone oxidoreductase subunit L
VLHHLSEHYHGIAAFIEHGLKAPPFWLAMAGLFTAWFVYTKKPGIAETAKQKLGLVHTVFENKYYFDRFNEVVFAGGARAIGWFFWKLGDVLMIDGLLVNGSARSVGWFSGILRKLQTGYLYTYAFSMIIGLLLLLGWFLWLRPGV